MSGFRIMRILPSLGAFMLLLLLPVIREDGRFLLLAVVCAFTIYQGITMRSVMVSTTFLAVADLIFGGDIGTAEIAYLGSVLLLFGLQRFLTIPAWAAEEGWRFRSMLRTVITAGLFACGTILVAFVVGDILYRSGDLIARLRSLLTGSHLAAILIAAVVTPLLVRRMSVPFRTRIRFGE